MIYNRVMQYVTASLLVHHSQSEKYDEVTMLPTEYDPSQNPPRHLEQFMIEKPLSIHVKRGVHL